MAIINGLLACFFITPDEVAVVDVAPESFTAGTRSVNCWVMKDNGVGGFSTLTGSATGDFLIDGAPPAEPPPRNPLREDGQATAPGAGAPTGSAGAPDTN